MCSECLVTAQARFMCCRRRALPGAADPGVASLRLTSCPGQPKSLPYPDGGEPIGRTFRGAPRAVARFKSGARAPGLHSTTALPFLSLRQH
eukprot:365606-Chlamydomonas_euryale.AAC.3